MTKTDAEQVVSILRDLYPTADDVSDGLMTRFKARLETLAISIKQADAALTEMRMTRKYFNVTDAWACLLRAAQTERISSGVRQRQSESPADVRDREEAEARASDAASQRWWASLSVAQRKELLARFRGTKASRYIRLASLSDVTTDGSPFARGMLKCFAERNCGGQ